MILLPAIDIKDGTCVRLYKGDFATVEKVAEDPLQTAQRFAVAGATWLHMVDLDGALAKEPVNQEIFLQIAKNTDLKIELGGGIRTMAHIDAYIAGGIDRVILGSAALGDPALVAAAVAKYGSAIAIGIDAKDELVRGEGWLSDSGVHYLTMAQEMAALGVETIIYTDISKDGTLTGPNLAQLAAIRDAVPGVQIIASGGVTDLGDIHDLLDLNLYGAICGKSLYQGTLDLAQAIAIAGQQ